MLIDGISITIEWFVPEPSEEVASRLVAYARQILPGQLITNLRIRNRIFGWPFWPNCEHCGSHTKTVRATYKVSPPNGARDINIEECLDILEWCPKCNHIFQAAEAIPICHT